MERLFSSYIAKRACCVAGRVFSMPVPRTILKPIINAYSAVLGVESSNVEVPEGGFRSFSDFFARRLKKDARIICSDPCAVISPSDGEILDFGEIDARPSPTFSIKDSTYDVNSLLGNAGEKEAYAGGGYMIIYLHPRDYHRVHVPIKGGLSRVRHIPGARFPVNNWLRDKVECIYSKNERTVFQFVLPNSKALSVVMVAAFGVGNIETQFSIGSKGQDVVRERDFSPPVELNTGDELGAFLLGSTVVMTWSKNALKFDSSIERGPIAMGLKLGTIVE